MKVFMFRCLLVFAVIFTSSCTPQSWLRFQEVLSKVTHYVSDGVAVLNAARGAVDLLVPPEQRGTVRDVYAAINAANNILLIESRAVRDSNSALELPRQIGASFPQFIQQWDQISELLRRQHINVGEPIDTGSRENRFEGVFVPVPLIVRDARSPQ